MPNKIKILGAIVVLFVVGVVVLGIMTSGSPRTARLRQIDQTKSERLQQLSWNIENYYTEKKSLPESLEEVELLYKEQNMGYYGDPNSGMAVDPETKEPFTYKKIDTLSFELCGTFHLASEEHEERLRQGYSIAPYAVTNFFDHEAGEQCFTVKVIPEQLIQLK